MATTILKKWQDSFGGANGDPTKNRAKTSRSSVYVRNTLSDPALGGNDWAYGNEVPTYRHTGKVGLLWDHFLNPNVGDATVAAARTAGNVGVDAGDQSLDSSKLSMGILGYDRTKYQNRGAAAAAVLTAISANNNIRSIGLTDAIDAFQRVGFGDTGEALNQAGAVKGFFYFMDKVQPIAANNFIKNNYRLAAANPDGVFSNFTSAAFSDTIDGEKKTIALSTF